MPDNFEAKLSRVFIGRETELELLSGLLNEAINGSGSFVVFNGEAGVGKSRLIQHFIESQNSQNILYVEESFKGIRAHEPYLPFLRIIEKLFAGELQPGAAVQ